MFLYQNEITIRPESALLSYRTRHTNDISCIYRLIKSYDAAHHQDIFSVFLTTATAQTTDEEFLFDICREKTTAEAFLEMLYQNSVTACTLHHVAEQYLQ